MSVTDDAALAAPGRLELVRAFVNTLDIEEGTDELAGDPGRWLTDRGLTAHRPRLTAADRARLVAVREALRALLLANNSGDPAPPEALRALNEQRATVGLRFERAGAELVCDGGGIDDAIGCLLGIVHEAMRAGDWERLKACPAEDCHWAFYDQSRNRSGVWCLMGDCGNRAKARAYRERRRAAGSR